MEDSFHVKVIEDPKHLFEIKTTYFWTETLLFNVVKELTILKEFHHDVGNMVLGAVFLNH